MATSPAISPATRPVGREEHCIVLIRCCMCLLVILVLLGMAFLVVVLLIWLALCRG